MNRQGPTRIGFGYLSSAAIVIAVLFTLRGVVEFALIWRSIPAPGLTLAAWILVVVAGVAGSLIASRRAGSLPFSVYLVLLAVLAGATTLDIVASSGFAPGTPTPTVPAGTGAVLLALTPYRPLIDSMVTSAVFVVVLSAAAGATAANSVPGTTVQLVASACAAPVFGAIIFWLFSRAVSRELDVALSATEIGAPAGSLGPARSRMLIALDSEAEELLESVASGRTPLPLDPDTARTAAELASGLRTVLLESGSTSWLHHAVESSRLLSSRISISDDRGLTDALDAGQRSGLLTTVWMLADAGRGRDFRVRVDVAERPQAAVGIVVEAEGISQRRVDPALWTALGSIGQHRVSGTREGIRIDLTVPVRDNEV